LTYVRTSGGLPPLGSANASYCRIATGTYTGDGTIAKAITGVGFQSKVIWISHLDNASGAIMGVYWKMNLHTTDYADLHNASGDNNYDDKITIDVDGFTVDDNGSDTDPNKNGEVYYYICLG